MKQAVSFVTLIIFVFSVTLPSYPVQNSDIDELLKQGKQAYIKGNFKQAIKKLSMAVKLIKNKENLLDAYLTLSLTYFTLGDEQNAEKSIKNALRVKPDLSLDADTHSPKFRNFASRIKKNCLITVGFKIIPGADLYIDDVYYYKNVEKAVIKLVKGTYTVKVEKNGFKSFVQEVRFDRGEEIKEINLEKLPEKPLPETGKIEKKGKIKKKKKKRKKFSLLLIVGAAIVVGVVVLMVLKKRKGETPQDPQKGSMQVRSTPDGASIWLDGNQTGYTTNVTIRNVEPGPRVIRLVKEGYWVVETTVHIQAGIEALVTKTLEESGIEWIRIPAGEFRMGDNFNEGDSDELPVHTVNLDEYYISKYEITFEQYDRFCNETGGVKPSDNGWGRYKKPAINVSWKDAQAFCEWLSERTGQNIHLPYEAQWEKAARGSDQLRFPWGNETPDCGLLNYNNCLGETVPVGSSPGGVSPYGVSEMGGNVQEWCQDWYGADYYLNAPAQNPNGPESGVSRVIRGGSCFSGPIEVRSTIRYKLDRYDSHPTIGFRICRD